MKTNDLAKILKIDKVLLTKILESVVVITAVHSAVNDSTLDIDGIGSFSCNIVTKQLVVNLSDGLCDAIENDLPTLIKEKFLDNL